MYMMLVGYISTRRHLLPEILLLSYLGGGGSYIFTSGEAVGVCTVLPNGGYQSLFLLCNIYLSFL